jgi:hypothetical protein
MDDGVLGTVAGLHGHHGDAGRRSGDVGRCTALCAVCGGCLGGVGKRARCCGGNGDGGDGRDDNISIDQQRTTSGCTAVVCGSVCTRTMLIVVNLTFLLAGWTLIGVGLWIHIFQESLVFGVLLRGSPGDTLLIVDRLPIALILTGTVVTIIGFLGCCGACSESVCFLGFYAVLLVLSFVAQVTIATLAVTFNRQVQQNLVFSMQYQIQYQYNITAKPTNRTDTVTYQITTAWDRLQIEMNCCGVIGPQDYLYSLWYNNTPHSEGPFVPNSCCRALIRDSQRLSYASENECQMAAIKYAARNQENGNGNGNGAGGLDAENGVERDDAKAQGCYAAVMDRLSEYFPFVFFVLAIDVLQLMNVIYACVLINLVRRKQVDYSWCEDDELD